VSSYVPLPGALVEVIADIPDILWRPLRGRRGVVLGRTSSVEDRPVVVCLDGCTLRGIQGHDEICTRSAATFSAGELSEMCPCGEHEIDALCPYWCGVHGTRWCEEHEMEAQQ
jgi:hypothetical protein